MAATDNPKISVLMPVFNARPFLAEAVQSILNQDYTDFELLIIDDGSTDDSEALLQQFSTRDHRLRWLRRENRGLAATLNELVEMARGEYLARMDADDASMPQRFSLQEQFLSEHPEHVVVGGAVEWMNSSGRPIGVIRSPLDHDRIDAAHLRGHSAVWHPTAMLRATAVRKVGGYRPEMVPAEDLDLWLRLGEVGKIANLPQVVLRYRIHQASISARRQSEQRARCRQACDDACRRRDVASVFDAQQSWRSGDDRQSRHDFALRYGWLAWQHGHRLTCWEYAVRALCLRPWSLSSWQLAYGSFKSRPQH